MALCSLLSSLFCHTSKERYIVMQGTTLLGKNDRGVAMTPIMIVFETNYLRQDYLMDYYTCRFSNQNASKRLTSFSLTKNVMISPGSKLVLPCGKILLPSR